MKKILFILLIVFCGSNSIAQRIIPVFGLEGGTLGGGLSNVPGYSGNWMFNGSFWVDLVGTNRNGHPTLGVKIKLNYNYYDMSTGNGNSDLIIGETTIPVLFKVCISSNTENWVKKENGEYNYYSLKRDLFFFVGPQVGFPMISNNPVGPYQKMDYSVVAGGELYFNNRMYFALYEQTGLSNIYPSRPQTRLSGFTAAIGFRLL
jgi:hypothetical protein